MPELYRQLLDWSVPVFLGALVYSLNGIKDEIKTMAANLAIVTTKITDHEKRLDRLEQR